MSYLTKLTISNATRQVSGNPIDARRANLLAKLDEQLAMATALVENRPFNATRKVWVEQEDGTKQRIERAKRLSAWYWQDVSGKFLFEVRYGAQKLELAKGKHAIDVGSKDKLVDVIKTVIGAVQGGELDAVLNSVTASKSRKQKAKA
jgi:capsid portal protein